MSLITTNDTHNNIDERRQLLHELERIEGLPQIQKWQATRDFVLKLHPGYVREELDFIASVKEIREKENLKPTGASKTGALRHTMKIPQYIYTALLAVDPSLYEEMSGRNPEAQDALMKKLYKAFPMYRVARIY